MKITMYELYGKIYDENPPKHIKVYGEDWYWNDYDGYVTKESLKTTPDAQIYLMDKYRTFMNLDQEVEIIEAPKKIEKIARCDYIKMTHYGDLYKPTENEEILRIKINELIDVVNELKRDK